MIGAGLVCDGKTVILRSGVNDVKSAAPPPHARSGSSRFNDHP